MGSPQFAGWDALSQQEIDRISTKFFEEEVVPH